MKPTTNQTSLQANGVQESVSFGIKDSGYAHIFHVLRNQLYSDSILAVIREYTCNAVDAHVQAGKAEQPIEVTVPTKLNLEFKVRDYGDALSDEEVRDIYAFYGESTKRETNNQTGMLGIGSKSGFAYGDNFIIVSYIDGLKRTWNAFIDPSQVGQISKLSEESTDEPDGIEIVIPVREQDVDSFQHKAQNLFKHFKVKPIVKGCAMEEEEAEKELLFSGEDWAWRSTGRWRDFVTVAVMGNIAYPIDRHDLNFSEENEDLRNLVVDSLTMQFDIGDLDIAASREKLQFTDRTQAAVTSKLKKVRSELVANAQKEFADCSSLWDAKCLLQEVNDMANGLYELREIITDGIEFNGEPIKGYSVNLPNGWEMSKLRKPDRGYRYRFDDGHGRIMATKDTVVIYNDLGTRTGVMNRVLDFAINKKKTVAVLSQHNDEAKMSELKKVFDGELLKMSELTKYPLANFYSNTSSGSTSTNKEHQKKINSKVFEVDFTKKQWQNTDSNYFKASEVDEQEGGVYVVIDRFKVVGSGCNREARQVVLMKERLAEIGVDFPEKVYAFKVKNAEMPTNSNKFVHLWDWAESAIKAKIDEENLSQVVVDIEHKSDNSKDWCWSDKVVDDLLPRLLDSDGLMATNLKGYQQLRHSDKVEALEKITRIAEAYDFGRVDMGKEPSFDLKTSNESVQAKYSALDLIDWYPVRRSAAYDGYDGNGEIMQKLADYINMVDVCSIDS